MIPTCIVQKTTGGQQIATTSQFLTKINANYKTKTPSKRGLSNLTINFDTGDRGYHCYNTAAFDDRLQHHCNNRFNCNNSAFDRFSKRIFMQHFECKVLHFGRAFIFLHKKYPPFGTGDYEAIVCYFSSILYRINCQYTKR